MVFVIPLMLITTGDVIGRGFFNKPIAGTFELSEYMLAIIILLGAAYTQQVKGHVAVDFLTSQIQHQNSGAMPDHYFIPQSVHCDYTGWQGYIGD